MKIKKHSIVMIKCTDKKMDKDKYMANYYEGLQGMVGIVVHIDNRFKYPILIETECGIISCKKKHLELLI